MAVTALIKFTQGATTDLAGVAVQGTTSGGTVTVTNGDNTNVVSWKFELLYVPPGSSIPLTVQGPSATNSFTFAQPDRPGSYRVRLTVFDGLGGQDVDIRNFIVAFPNGYIAPPYQGLPQPLPLTGTGSKPNEMNVGGSSVGWDGTDDTNHKLLYQAIQQIDTLTGGGVPSSRTITTTSPLRIDGGASADLSANRTLSILAATTLALGVIQLAGDLAGTATAVDVAKVHGTAITTAGGAIPTGSVLRTTAGAVADWGPVNLANSNSVTGRLPENNVALGGTNTVFASDGATNAFSGSPTLATSLRVRAAGATSTIIRDFTGGSFAAIYMGNITESTDNYALSSNGTTSWAVSLSNGAGAFGFSSGTTPNNFQLAAFQTVGGANQLIFGTNATVDAVPSMIRPSARTTDKPTARFTIQGMDAASGATGVNRVPGEVWLSVGSPTNGGTTRAFVVIANDTEKVLQVGRLSPSHAFYPNKAALWLGNITPTDTNLVMSISSSGNGLVLHAPSASGAISFTNPDAIALGTGIASFQLLSNQPQLVFQPNATGARSAIYIAGPGILGDVPKQDLYIRGQARNGTEVTNLDSGSVIVELRPPTGLGVRGVFRVMYEEGNDAFTVNSITKYTFFGGPTYTTGTAVPSSTEIDGSQYLRTGGTNGDWFLRRNNVWVSPFTTTGAIPPTAISAGTANTILWTNGSLAVSWTDIPIINTSLQVGTGTAKALVCTIVGGTDPALYLGNTTPDANNYTLTAISNGNAILNSPSATAVTFGNTTGLVFQRNGGVNEIRFASDRPGFIGMIIPTGDVVGPTLTIQGGRSGTGATASPNADGPPIIYEVQSPRGTGLDGFHKFRISSNFAAQFGRYLDPVFPNFWGIYLGNITPALANWTIMSDASSTWINAPVDTDAIYFTHGNTETLFLQRSGSVNRATFWRDRAAKIDFLDAVVNTTSQDITITSQAPNAGSTGAFRSPGSVIVEVPAAVSSGPEGYFKVKTAGALQAHVGLGLSVSGSALAGFGALWLGPAVPGSGTAYAIVSNGTTNTAVQAGNTDNGLLTFVINGSTVASVSRNALSSTGNFAGICLAPDKSYTVGMRNNFDDSTDTFDFRILAQAPFASATGTHRTPGNLVLETASATNGETKTAFVKIVTSGTTGFWVGQSNSGLPTIWGSSTTPTDQNYGILFGSTGGITLGARLADGGVRFTEVIGGNATLMALFSRRTNSVNVPGLIFNSDVAYTITAQGPGVNVVPFDLTILAPWPNGSSTTTGRTPGNVIVDLGVPVNSQTAAAFFEIKSNGSLLAYMGQGDTSVGGFKIWSGAIATPNVTDNYAFATSTLGTITNVNAPSGGAVRLQIAGQNVMRALSTTHLDLFNSAVDWTQGTGAPGGTPAEGQMYSRAGGGAGTGDLYLGRSAAWVSVLSTFVPLTTQVVAGAGLTGGGALSGNVTLNVVANADGSIVVAADDVRVGIINDTQHGTRGGGTLHTNVSNTAAGFATAITAANRVLLSTSGTSAVWGQVDLATSQVTGALPVANLANGSGNQILATVGSTPTWITVGGDVLAPMSAATVIGLTGSSGVVAMHGHTFRVDTAVTQVTFEHTAPGSGDGNSWVFHAQDGAAGGADGGSFIIFTGKHSGGGDPGAFSVITDGLTGTTRLSVSANTGVTVDTLFLIQVGATIRHQLTATTVEYNVGTFQFGSGVTAPVITQATLTNNAGQTMQIVAQSGNGTDKIGGLLALYGGARTGTGLKGGVRVTINGIGGDVMMEAIELTQNATATGTGRFLSLNKTSVLQTSDLSGSYTYGNTGVGNNGDGVIVLNNCQVEPTRSISNAATLFSSVGRFGWVTDTGGGNTVKVVWTMQFQAPAGTPTFDGRQIRGWVTLQLEGNPYEFPVFH